MFACRRWQDAKKAAALPGRSIGSRSLSILDAAGSAFFLHPCTGAAFEHRVQHMRAFMLTPAKAALAFVGFFFSQTSYLADEYFLQLFNHCFNIHRVGDLYNLIMNLLILSPVRVILRLLTDFFFVKSCLNKPMASICNAHTIFFARYDNGSIS